MRNKERTKGFVCGLIVAMLISTVSFAATNKKTIEVIYDAVKDIKINQVSKMPKGDLAPFVYKGTTFVPLRFISENLGEQVKWDSSTKTVYIGEMADETATYIGDGIDYMNFQKGSGYHSFKYNYNSERPIKDNVGNEYVNYLTMNHESRGGWSYIEFPTNGEYKRFKGTVGLTDNKKDTTLIYKAEIFADDELVYSKVIEAGVMPEDIDVNIKNALKVKFKFSNIGEDYGNTELGFFNPRFVK